MRNPLSVIITAAGSSSRFGKETKKEYEFLDISNHITVLSEAVFKFLSTDMFSSIIIVIPEGDEEHVEHIVLSDSRINLLLKKNKITSSLFFISGDSTRQKSVYKALQFISSFDDLNIPEHVLIHDGARPFVSINLIKNIINNLNVYDAISPAIPVTDTQKIVKNNLITTHLNRAELYAVQTPQAFNFKKILQAHIQASNEEKTYTDDTEIFSKYISESFICTGEQSNKKITFATDLNTSTNQNCQYRIGLGYDLHRLIIGKEIILGGVKIPCSFKCDAHSDGDVLLHAICDSLLGAAGFSDIGELFPPSKNKWKNADSKKLLEMAWEKCNTHKKWHISNIDCVIAIQKPKILPYREKIISSIASILRISPSKIFVKAKTGEGVGIIGSSQAVAVWVNSIIFHTYQTSQV